MRIIVRFIILTALILAWAAPAAGVTAAADPPTIYYAGPQGAVKTAIDLTRFPYTQDISAADVIILNGAIPDANAAAAQLRAGAGLLLILGAEITAEQAGTLLGAPVVLAPQTDAVTLVESGAGSELGSILWNTAPQLRERIQLSAPGGEPAGLEPAVLSLESGEATDCLRGGWPGAPAAFIRAVGRRKPAIPPMGLLQLPGV